MRHCVFMQNLEQAQSLLRAALTWLYKAFAHIV